MRSAFFNALEDIAQSHDDIYLLTADLGYRLFDSFKDRFPGQFVNVGVAEPNMIGISAGLALSRKNVYCYSMIPFLIMRAYEQIRIDIAYHNLNVKLIGAGGGFTYALEGFTHCAVEDLSIMRSLPNMTVVVPSDPLEAEQLAAISYDYPFPLYVRLEQSGFLPTTHTKPALEIGKGLVLREGKDVAVFAVGNMVRLSEQAIDALEKEGISATLINMHTLKPLDVGLIKECAMSHRSIFTVEEHNISGGLGSAVAEVLAESSYSGAFKRIGISEPKNIVGDANHHRERHGLTAEVIIKTILNHMRIELWVGG